MLHTQRLALILLLASAFSEASASTASHSSTQSSSADSYQELRIAMTAAFVSESGIHVYEEIADYLGKKLRRKVTFVTGLSYNTVNEMIDENIIELAFVCGLPYTMKHDLPNPVVRLLAAPVMQAPRYQDRPIYYSDVIVHKNSPFQRFEDLRDTVFVYNDEISNSGYNMPRAYLISLHETRGFFSNLIRSGSHEESIRMVAEGQAQASAVDSLVLDYDRRYNPKFASQVRIIKSLGPAAIPPLIASTTLPEKEFQLIQDVLLEMANDPKGKAILNSAGVKRFQKVADDFYDDIRAMRDLAKKTGFSQIK